MLVFHELHKHYVYGKFLSCRDMLDRLSRTTPTRIIRRDSKLYRDTYNYLLNSLDSEAELLELYLDVFGD